MAQAKAIITQTTTLISRKHTKYIIMESNYKDKIIDGRAIADRIKNELKARIETR